MKKPRDVYLRLLSYPIGQAGFVPSGQSFAIIGQDFANLG